jgi:hypothetical protein
VNHHNGGAHGLHELRWLRPGTLYLGDNGRCLCGEHAGAIAAITGCDPSGQPVMRLDYANIVAAGYDPDLYHCEQPGCTVRVSRIVLPSSRPVSL